jgi:CHAD domain-containing protein
MRPPERHFVFSGAVRRAFTGLEDFGYRIESGGVEEWQGSYYDTHSGSLHRRGVRLLGLPGTGEWLWLAADASASLAETEEDVPAVPPPPDGAPVELRSQRLLPVLRLCVRRRLYRLVAPSRATLSMAVGVPSFGRPLSGEEAAGRRLLSLTVPGGLESEAAVIASFLRDLFRLRPLDGDLLAYGLGLFAAPLPGAPVPDRLRLESADGLRVAGHKILARQAYKMRANTEGALMDLDPEFVHDIRVATRRARFALRLFGEVLGSSGSSALREELSWIAGLLGRVRDLDILHANIRRCTAELAGDPQVPAAVEAHLGARRTEALALLREALSSARYQAILEGLETLGSGVTSEGQADPGPPVREAAPPLVRTSAERLRRWLKRDPAALTPAQLHRIRIHFKRLRYTCEFFNDVFAEAFSDAIRQFVDYQDCLGEHQDAQVAQENLLAMADRLVEAGEASPAVLMFLGGIIQSFHGMARNRRAQFETNWKKFPRQVKALEAAVGGAG